jgi:ABC-type phosphate transport system substrate-binding protein
MTLPPNAACSSSRRRSRWRAACIIAGASVVIAALLGEGARASDTRSSFKLIVHPANPVTALSADTIRQIYLKQKVRWDDDKPIKPVDRELRSPVRAQFSSSVLGRSVQAVRSYWLQRIFSGGHVPPPELSSDEAVIRYVSAERGAVGYVAATADTARTKVIAID